LERLLQYPFDSALIMKKQRSIKRILLEKGRFIEKKIAILGGSTTADIKNILELFLIKDGIRPFFYESEYNRYYEDGMFENEELKSFKPDIIFIHTSTVNIMNLPEVNDTDEIVNNKLEAEYSKYKGLWEQLETTYNCTIIQNNFELPHYRMLGNLDCSDVHGYSSFIMNLNARFAEYARTAKGFYINDIHYLSAEVGLNNWYDRSFWHAYKYALSYEAIPVLAHNLANIITAILGKSKKCLVLDLDNTLWGGVIGDDGLNGIQIGKETPVAEAYTEFQEYVLKLKKRGVILAVCSKNDLANAKEGFSHPDSVLSVNDFVSFKANWEPKHINISQIAEDINIGVDSLVFVDDNPVERKIVTDNLASVLVPEVDATEVVSYLNILDRTGCFEPISISKDDLIRNQAYQENAKRNTLKEQFVSYDEFLASLNMKAEVTAFKPIYLERIAQLTNKSNQFNLTTKRYTLSEIEAVANNRNYITLYGRLADKFGDNGLVSVVIGEVKENTLHIDAWLMSCRVLKRGMEQAMFDELVSQSQQLGINIIKGYYYKTAKNSMVAELYKVLGFELFNTSGEDTVWEYSLPSNYINQNHFIIINEKRN